MRCLQLAVAKNAVGVEDLASKLNGHKGEENNEPRCITELGLALWKTDTEKKIRKAVEYMTEQPKQTAMKA